MLNKKSISMKKVLEEMPSVKPYHGEAKQESADNRIRNLQERIYQMQEEINTILDYLSEQMEVELVRNVRDGRLRFASREIR